MPISNGLSNSLFMIFCAGICTLPLGALAIILVLLRAKEKKTLKVTAIFITTGIFLFVCSFITLSLDFTGTAPSPILKPSISDIIGVYYLNNSTKYLQEKGYPALKSSSFIEFKNDLTFETENMPDLISSHRSAYENNVNSTFVSGAGIWKIDFDNLNSEWRLNLEFKNINDKSSHQPIHLWIYGKNPPFVLYSIVGDPDSYDWLMYQRK